jgi:SAM-dependent methyltransferase
VLVEVSCYVCGSAARTPWATENGFDACRCSGCGLVYVNPRPGPELLTKAAESGLHAGEAELDVTGRYGGSPKLRFYARRLADLYPSAELAGQQGSWLDVGCGYGEFLEVLAQASGGTLKLTGLEPNRTKTESARARGLDVGFFDLDVETRRFEYVSLLNVYSHLPDPPSYLERLRTLLVPNGELVLQTGNWAELERSRIPDRLHLPDHLSFASEALLVRLLERAGFELLALRRYPMFRRGLATWLRDFGRSPAAGPSDLWFRARVR